MLQAYVGIVSRRGLELLYPEHPHTTRFLFRFVQRDPTRLAVMWSVIPSEIADQALHAVQDANTRYALELIQFYGLECGLLLPEHSTAAEVPIIPNWR